MIRAILKQVVHVLDKVTYSFVTLIEAQYTSAPPGCHRRVQTEGRPPLGKVNQQNMKDNVLTPTSTDGIGGNGVTRGTVRASADRCLEEGPEGSVEENFEEASASSDNNDSSRKGLEGSAEEDFNKASACSEKMDSL